MYLNRYPLRPEPPRDDFAPSSVRYDRTAGQFVIPYLGRPPRLRAIIVATVISLALAALFIAILWGARLMTAETLSIRQAAAACGMAYETFRKRWRRMVADESFPQPFHGHIWDAAAVVAWRQARSQTVDAVYTRPRLVPKPPVDDQQRALAGLRAIKGLLMRFLHPTLTPARRAWLELVERDGDNVARSLNSPVTNHCLRLGWVEQLRIVAGAAYSESEFQRNFPAGTLGREMAMRAFDGFGGYRITEDGRQVLAEARARETV